VGNYSQQRHAEVETIRPQDSPFVSNRVNFSKAGATLKLPIPKTKELAVLVSSTPTPFRAATSDRPHHHHRPDVHLSFESEPLHDLKPMTSKPNAQLPRFVSIAAVFVPRLGQLQLQQRHLDEILPPLTPANADANAGSWKMIVLTGPTQVPVTAPSPTSDPGYQSELATIKSAQANLTDAQKTAIAYWSSGGVLRGNEIMRELVARSDLRPPLIPTEATPYQIPQTLRQSAYPFSNPPRPRARVQQRRGRTVRSAQGRLVLQVSLQPPSPSKVDTSIKSLMPTDERTSYPPKTPSKQESTPLVDSSLSHISRPRSTPKQPSSNKPHSSPPALPQRHRRRSSPRQGRSRHHRGPRRHRWHEGCGRHAPQSGRH